MGKNRAAARAIKQAYRRSLEMSWENAEDTSWRSSISFASPIRSRGAARG